MADRSPNFIDPVGFAREASQALPVTIMTKEPLRSWFTGLLEIKAQRGRKLSWDEMLTLLNRSAALVLKDPKAHLFIGGATRPLRPEELETVKEFVGRAYRDRSTMAYFAKKSFPELWAKVQGK